jgi:hypothetical protein
MPKEKTLAYVNEYLPVTPEQIGHWERHPRDGDRLPTLVGKCPKCQHRNEVRLPDTVMAGSVPAGASAAPPPVATRQVICTCNQGHDQPDGIIGGCGRFWLAKLTLRADGSYELTVADDLGMLPAAAALNAAVAGQDKAVQTSAEKWTGAIAALYGLFAFSGIVTAKDALLGLSPAGKGYVGAALVVAIAAGAFALVHAYRAAFGWPYPMDVSDDEKLAAWFDRRRAYAADAAGKLRRAVRAALISLAALTVMAMLAWFLPRTPVSPAPAPAGPVPAAPSPATT